MGAGIMGKKGSAQLNSRTYKKLVNIRQPEWDEAACRDVPDSDIFFPDRADSLEGKRAIKVCKTCPLQHDCLAFALINDIRYGIWGGTSGRMRRDLRLL